MKKLHNYIHLCIAIILPAVVVGLLLIIGFHFERKHPDYAYGKAEDLNFAIAAGDIPKIERLITIDKTILEATDVNSTTPITCAVGTGRRDIVDLLIKLGANINQAGPMGITPLHRAAARGDEAMVEFLLGRGAKINAVAFHGITPLHMAVNTRQRGVVQILVNKGADLTAKGSFDQMRPNSKDLYTPLQWAIKIHADNVVDVLRSKRVPCKRGP